MEAVDSGAHLAFPAIVMQELEVGVLRSRHCPKARAKLDIFLNFISEVISYDAEDALCAAEISVALMRRGEMIGAHDLLIAAQAIRRNAILVTHNPNEFSRVTGLKWEDWTLP